MDGCSGFIPVTAVLNSSGLRSEKGASGLSSSFLAQFSICKIERRSDDRLETAPSLVPTGKEALCLTNIRKIGFAIEM